MQVLIVRTHCRECCSPTIPSRLVGRSSPHLETILYDTNPPPQPLAKTCVVLGVCQTPTRWVTYIRSPTQNPSTHACVPPGGWWMLIFLLCENSIAYQVLHTPTHYYCCVVWVSHTPTLVVVGVCCSCQRDTRLKHYFILFLFLCTTHAFVRYAQCVLWLESLILAQDERWRRA